MMNQPPDLPMFPPLSVRVQRTYSAPRERVFHAWTDPQALEQWFKPLGMPITVAYLDLQKGGRYMFNVHGPTGKISTISGHYVEVVQPEKLVYTWTSEATDSCETLVTLLFTERGSLTDLTLIHERFTRPEVVQPHQEGWTSMLTLLDTLFAN